MICTERDYADKFDERLSPPQIVKGELYNLMSLTRGFGSLALSVPVTVDEIRNNSLTVALNNQALQPSQRVDGWLLSDNTWVPQVPDNLEGLFFRKPGTDIIVELVRSYFIKYGHPSAQHGAYTQSSHIPELGRQLDLCL